MGNTKSKKKQKEPDKLFERERLKETVREAKRKERMNPTNRRAATKQPAIPDPLLSGPTPPPAPSLAPAPASPVHSYDDDALKQMRYQLSHDSDAFLLNNILMSLQFFENYEVEKENVKSNAVSQREQTISEAMMHHHKHVLFADRLQEIVYEHVGYQREKTLPSEPLAPPRLFVMYDNIEVREPGDMSDYSAVLDAPFYKLRSEDSKTPGYTKLRKIEVLENAQSKEIDFEVNNSDDSIYSDSEKESNVSDGESLYMTKSEVVLEKLKHSKGNLFQRNAKSKVIEGIPSNFIGAVAGRRLSGPVKQYSSQVLKSNINQLNSLRQAASVLREDDEDNDSENDQNDIKDAESKPRKSILKPSRRLSGPIKEITNVKIRQNPMRNGLSQEVIAEDEETSDYKSMSSSRFELSDESDYGYKTIIKSSTPKKLNLSSNNSLPSGVLPDDCWTKVQQPTVNNWSDIDSDEEEEDTDSKRSTPVNLYETYYYLSSKRFMSNFVDNFIINLGKTLGFDEHTVNNVAFSEGASVYCSIIKNGTKFNYQIYPALSCTWPNAANQWIIRERKVIVDPRTNKMYQWPSKSMVRDANGMGCCLVPVGFRPKHGRNPDQVLEWRVMFPDVERYLESSLAHSQIRCYLFALTLYRTFLDIETPNKAKISIDYHHIKNHLFWECENNFAKWPEDRLGESLRIFLRDLYVHFGRSRFPNYFMENCNAFENIPRSILSRLQTNLKNIMEAPVMHLLKAVSKLKYAKRDFYPSFKVYILYEILTCKNPLRLLNPNIPHNVTSNKEQSESDDDFETETGNFWEREKARDKNYRWAKENMKQREVRKKASVQSKKRHTVRQEIEINHNISLPQRMDVERRRLVLEFFIKHFIEMACSSERFEAIKQALIYLEQAKRLCLLLKEETAGDTTSNDYMEVICDKLSNCQRKLINRDALAYKPRPESQTDRRQSRQYRKRTSRLDSNESDVQPSTSFAADIRGDSDYKTSFNIGYDIDSDEESKL